MTTCKRVASYHKISNASPDHKAFIDVLIEQAVAVDEIWIEAERGDASEVLPTHFFNVVEAVAKNVTCPVVAVTDSVRVADGHLLIEFGASRVVGRYDQFVAHDVEPGVWGHACGLGRFSLHMYVDRILNEEEPIVRITDKIGRVLEDDALHRLALIREEGVSEIIVSAPHIRRQRSHPSQAIERIRQMYPIQVLSHADDTSVSDIIGPLLSGADGVVTTLANDPESAYQIKETMTRYGLPARVE